MRFFVVGIVALALIATACNTEPRNAAYGEWELVSLVVDGVEVPAIDEFRPYLRLDADVSGGGGCNQIRGQYNVTDVSFVLSGMSMTERACAEPERMEQEERYFTALSAARSYEREDDELRLYDRDGNLLLRFEK